MDRLLVRLCIVAQSLYLMISIIYAWNGELMYEYDCIFSSSAIVAFLLCILVHSQGRYHCVYMRGLCYNLLFTSLFDFTDEVCNLTNDVETYLAIITFTWSLSILSTLILAIRHFIRVKKLIRKRNGIL